MAEIALDFVNRVTGDSCSFIYDTELHPFSGGECNTFAFQANERRIAVRIQRHLSAATRFQVEWQVQILEEIKKQQIRHLPTLIGYDLASTQVPLYAYVWADGSPLEAWTDHTPPLQVRRDILRTIAEVTLDMLKIQKSGDSALAWITSKIQRTRTSRAMKGNLPGVSVSECEALRNRIADFHLPAFDDAPHVLVHGDLHLGNIIVHHQRVECIVDLGFASVVPLQFSTAYPRFLTNEPRPVGDATTFDWSRCAYSQTQKEDRRFYLQSIKDMAPARGEYACIYSEILAREDEDDRYWWFSAASRLDMMRALKTKP